MAYLKWKSQTENMTPTERIEAFDKLDETEQEAILSSAADFLEMEGSLGKPKKSKRKSA